ncbi:MAG TPA: response regulator transcription factor [Methylomirabilota bacterium]|nr:response regulator transcription factor [Methylomirabilota bacterium]
MTKLIIAEDHLLVRKALQRLLSDQPSFQLVGEAADGFEAIEMTTKLKPHVLLLDLSLPKVHGLEVIRRVREDSKTPILVLSMHSDEPYVLEALKSGAAGYVLKDSDPNELVSAIQTVSSGGHFITPKLRHCALNAALNRTKGNEDPYMGLTSRERMVLQLAAQGQSSSEIGKHLFISRRTAETHRANLMRKLGLRSQTDLVRFAIRRGVLNP